MALLDQDHAFEIADALIAASPAHGTEVTLESTEDRFVRFGHEGPTQSADRERYSLAVRVRFQDGAGIREARAVTGNIDEGSAAAALSRAVVLARFASSREGLVPLGGAVDLEGTAPSRPTQDHSFKEKAGWIERALQGAEAESLQAAGLARTTVMSRSLVNSEGRRVHGATSRAEFSCAATRRGPAGRRQGGAGSGSSIACFVDQLDVDGVIAQALDAAGRSREPVSVQGEPMNVLLEPPAVAALLSAAREAGFGGRAFGNGTSFMAGRLGEALFGEDVTLVDDPYHRSLRGWRFDGEGEPRQRAALVNSGVLVAPLTDAYWARELDLPNTGHGAPKPSSAGPMAEHLVMEPGSEDRSALLDAVGDGLLVRELHDVHLAEPKTLTLTGMTGRGTFRVRGGQLAESVETLGFGQSLVEGLQRVLSVGKDAIRCAAVGAPDVVVPPVVIRDFRFTRASV